MVGSDFGVRVYKHITHAYKYLSMINPSSYLSITHSIHLPGSSYLYNQAYINYPSKPSISSPLSLCTCTHMCVCICPSLSIYVYICVYIYIYIYIYYTYNCAHTFSPLLWAGDPRLQTLPLPRKATRQRRRWGKRRRLSGACKRRFPSALRSNDPVAYVCMCTYLHTFYMVIVTWSNDTISRHSSGGRREALGGGGTKACRHVGLS